MTAIFTGLGAGLERGSQNILGGAGQVGGGALGRAGEGVAVNAATGNLVINRRDEFLTGLGLDIAVSRTYNSLVDAQDGDNGDQWQQSTSRRVFDHSGSTVKRQGGDGSVITYTWNSSYNAYVSTEGSGAYDTLRQVGSNWVWTDGATQVEEVYSRTDAGSRIDPGSSIYASSFWIKRQVDNDGNILDFTYSGAKLAEVKTENGEWVKYHWVGNNVRRIETGHSGGTLTRTWYNYDSQNRLASVTTDLTPEDGSGSDANVYIVNYSYVGNTNRIAAIGQTDGAHLAMVYDSSGRIIRLTQTAASGETRVTHVAYNAGVTFITHPDGTTNNLYYDSKGQLGQINFVGPQSGDPVTTNHFTYDSSGNVLTVRDQNGKTTTYQYHDSRVDGAGHRGLVTRIIDPNGNQIDRWYDDDNNMTMQSVTGSSEGTANAVQYTRYVYDGENHLRYMIDADGGVTEYRYNSDGTLAWEIRYPEHAYSVNSTLPSLSQMDSWRNGLGNRQSTQMVNYRYDARGNLREKVDYGYATNSGGASTNEGYAHHYYTYDQAGQLLSRRTASLGTETFVYDGMGRTIASTDLDGGTTNIVFQDSATKTVITNAAGAVTTNTYNKAGELISQTTSGAHDATGTSSYKYDKMGRLRMETDETGFKTYYLYDKLGRKIADINHYGEIAEYRYDKAGRLVATANYTNAISSANLSALANPNNTLQIANIRPASHSYDVWSWTVYDAKGRVIQSIDGAGGVSRFEYDKADRLVKTTNYYNKLSSSQLSSFRSAAPTSLVLPSANSRDTVSRVFYDRAGRLVGALDGEGYLTETVYDNAGQKIREIAYANKTSSSLWASGTFNQLRSNAGTTNSKNRSMYYAYDGKGQLRFTVDNAGNIVENIYWEGTKWHSVGLLRKTVAYAATISTSDYTYDALKAKAAAAANASNDRVTSYTYNAAGKVATATDVAGTRTTFTYDNRGNVVKTVVGTGSSARTTYNWYSAQGLLRFTQDAEGYLTRFDYDNENRLTREVTWANRRSFTNAHHTGQITGSGSWVDVRYTYDAAGRRNSMYDGEGNRTVWSWFRTGLLANEYVGYTDKNGATTDRSHTHFVYDGAGRKTRDIHGYGTSERADTWYYYDGLGNVTSTKDPNGKTTTFTYDEVGRVLTATDANGGVTRSEYNAFGEVVKTTDPRGNSTYTYYDNLGRVTKTRDAENYITETTYTQFGEIKTVTRRYNRTTSSVSTTTPPTVALHSKDAVTRFEYDKRGFVTKVTDAEGHFETYTYDAYGNRITARAKSSSTSKVAGGTTTYTYDKRGLLLSERLPVASYNNTGSVVSSTVTNRYEYDSRGNRTKMIEASGLSEQRTTQYVYDKANRLVETIGQTFIGKTPREYIKYDARGNVTETIDAGGGRTIFFYDDLNRKVVEINAVGTYTRYTYDKNSSVTQVRVYDNAVGLPAGGGALAEAPGAPGGGSRITNFTYDNLNRLKTSSITGARTGYWNGSSWVTTTSAITTTYTYDANGNVVKLQDPNGNTVWNYYDKAGRKTSMVDGERYRTDYTYDTNGNVTRERRFVNKAANPTSTTTPPSVSSNGSLDRITDFTYDRNGNRLTERRLNVLRHNGNGAHTNSHSTISYLYNGLGQVTRKTEATGEQTNYVYDAGGRLTQERRAAFTSYNGNVTPTVDYYYNGVGDLSRTRQRGQSGTSERVTRYTYDGGKLRTMTDAEGFQRIYWYHQSGLVSHEYYKRIKSDGTYAANYDGVRTDYDKLGRVTQKYQVTHNGSTWIDSGPRAVTTYNSHGDVASVAVGGRTQTQNKYDAAGRLWATNSGDGVWKYIGYDKNGNQTLAISSAGFNTNNRTFDYMRGQIGRSDVNATFTQYDKRNLAIRVVEEGRQYNGTAGTLTSSRTYNAFGEVSTETNAKGAKIEYTYNNMGKLIKAVNPTVQITNENGSTQWIKPTEDYYYDASGRLVASRDANGTYANGSSSNGGAKTANTGRLTKLSLLAGTGYDGSQALITKETYADGGVKETKYDIHGDARTLIDQIGRTTTQTFDRMGRVKQVNHAHGLVEHFAYDGLGQQIKKWNNFLVVGAFYDPYTGISNPGTPEVATTDYDTQGRVIRQKDFGGDVTTHTYTWDSNLSTGGAGTFGGWTEVKTYANGRSSTEKTDFFGRMVSKNDLGNRTTTYTYDVAGRLKTSLVSGLTTTFNYFNTGHHSSIATTSGSAGTVNTNWTRETATYKYDQLGQRLAEHLRQEKAVYTPGQTIWWNPYEPDFLPPTYTVTNSVVKNASVTYDQLGRVTNWSEAGSSISPAASTAYKYDAVGNIRRTTASYKNLDANGNATGNITKDYWFRYDNMNRVIIDRGVRSGNTIARGDAATNPNGTIDAGKEVLYNKAGERVAVLTTKYTAGYFFKGGGFPGTFAEQRESYTYDLGGRLTKIAVSTGATVAETAFGSGVPSGTIPAAPVNGTKRSEFNYDLMGRQLTQTDYAANGTTIVYSRQASYDSANRLTSDTTNTKRGNDTYRSITSYNYGSGSTYALGSVVFQTSTNYKNNNHSQAPNTRTDNTFFWRDGAVQATIRHKPNSSQSTTYTTSFIYDGLGRLIQANVGDYYSQTVKFTNDENGQIIRRDETSIANSTGAPHEVWYRFGGRQLGYVGNNGTADVSTEKSIAERTAAQSSAPPGVFRNGATVGSSYADFAQNYDPLNSYSQGAGGGSYTVNKGDTLQSIAQSVYGDANLWYKIAQLNGISGNVPLSEGQRINLPTGVVRSAHNSGTVSPYNPGEAIGDLTPTTTAPPKKGKKCGGFGAILLAVVAIAVATIVTAGVASVLTGATFKASLGAVFSGSLAGFGTSSTVLTTVGAIGAAATGAAASSIVTQGIRIAAGIQEKFSFKQVALAGIGSVVSGGVTSIFGKAGNALGAAARAAGGSAVTQGIGVATGLQDKFNWAGVAAAGVGAGAAHAASGLAGSAGHGVAGALGLKGGAYLRVSAGISKALSGAAGAIANAATRSAIEGASFGANVVAAIPDVVANSLQAMASACFTGETLVHTPMGPRRIDEIRVGDLVYSRDEHFEDERVQTRRVQKLFRYEDRAVLDVTVAFEDGEDTFRATPEHPFAVVETGARTHSPDADVRDGWADNGIALIQEVETHSWMPAGELRAGDRVIDIIGRTGMVVAIEPVGLTSTVHNFAVEDHHTYFVGATGTWVHNQYVNVSDTGLTRRERLLRNVELAQATLEILAQQDLTPESREALLMAAREGLELFEETSEFERSGGIVSDVAGSAAALGGIVGGYVTGAGESALETLGALANPIETIEGLIETGAELINYLDRVISGDANPISDVQLAAIVWEAGIELERSRLYLSAGEGALGHLWGNVRAGEHGGSEAMKTALMFTGVGSLKKLSRIRGADAPETNRSNLDPNTGSTRSGRLSAHSRKALAEEVSRIMARRAASTSARRRSNLFAEAKGTVFAAREANRLGYGHIEAFVQNRSGHGVDMIVSNRNGRYAIFEAKGGVTQRSISSLSVDRRGLQQGTHAYNIDRLERVADSPGAQGQALAERILDAYETNPASVRSYASFYGSRSTFRFDGDIEARRFNGTRE